MNTLYMQCSIRQGKKTYLCNGRMALPIATERGQMIAWGLQYFWAMAYIATGEAI